MNKRLLSSLQAHEELEKKAEEIAARAQAIEEQVSA